MKNVIVGTAGHIDHGKSTLIKALTGKETDNLREEQKRGISIELGFTYFDLPNKNRVGIIDVPGHEKFIRNMLAGAAGIDIFLLVIAADEGVMPQTREHANILSFLNIKDGIIVLTKADSVEDEFRALVKEDIRDQFKGSFLEDAPIIEVDSISKKGLDKLIETIQDLSEGLEEKSDTAPPRINVDRVFTLKGFGTIITGTLLDGKLSTSNEMFLYPSNKPVKIRSIQVHGENVDRAYPGQRTAINISNLTKGEIHRGDVIAEDHSVEISRMIDVRIRLIDNSDYSISHWDRLRLYHGSKEILCRAVPLDRELIGPGDSALVQLRLEDEIVCKKGDEFVIRSYSPMVTIGGGTIIDSSTRKNKAFDPATIETLKIKEEGSIDDIIEEFLRQREVFYTRLENITTYTGESKELVEETLQNLMVNKNVIDINDSYIHRDQYEKLKDSILATLNNYHKNNSLSLGLSKEELRSQVNKDIKTKDFNLLLDLIEQEELIDIYSNFVSLKSFSIELSKEEIGIKEELMAELKSADLSNILNIEDLAKDSKVKKDLIYYLIDIERKAKLLADGYVIDMEKYNQVKAKAIDYLKEKGEISLGEFRDLINSSRKNCLLLLEDFDRERITIRQKDVRKLFKSN